MKINEYFSKLNYDELKRKILSFDRLKFEDYTDDELLDKLVDIFAIDNKFYNPIYTIKVPCDEYYCRIRTKSFFDDFPNAKAFDKSWILGNPNPEIGRMNRKGEKGLYVSKSIHTAIAECRVKEGEAFTCGIFEFTENLSILMTCISNNYYDVQKEHEEKAKLLNDFLYRYLTMRNDEKGVEVYRITNLLNKLFLGHKEADGLFYKSSVDDGYNLFINESSVGKCVLTYMFVGKIIEGKVKVHDFVKVEGGKINVEAVGKAEKMLKRLGANL